MVVHGGKILLLSFHEHVVDSGELCLFPLQLLLDGGVRMMLVRGGIVVIGGRGGVALLGGGGICNGGLGVAGDGPLCCW